MTGAAEKGQCQDCCIDYYPSPGNCEQCACTQDWQACRHFSFKSKKAVPAAGSWTISTTTNGFWRLFAEIMLFSVGFTTGKALSILGRLAAEQG